MREERSSCIKKVRQGHPRDQEEPTEREHKPLRGAVSPGGVLMGEQPAVVG